MMQEQEQGQGQEQEQEREQEQEQEQEREQSRPTKLASHSRRELPTSQPHRSGAAARVESAAASARRDAGWERLHSGAIMTLAVAS